MSFEFIHLYTTKFLGSFFSASSCFEPWVVSTPVILTLEYFVNVFCCRFLFYLSHTNTVLVCTTAVPQNISTYAAATLFILCSVLCGHLLNVMWL